MKYLDRYTGRQEAAVRRQTRQANEKELTKAGSKTERRRSTLAAYKASESSSAITISQCHRCTSNLRPRLSVAHPASYERKRERVRNVEQLAEDEGGVGNGDDVGEGALEEVDG
jgi:hypothetical protein